MSSSGDDQTLTAVSKKLQHMHGEVPQADIESFYEFIRSQPNGKETLAAMLQVPKPLNPSGDLNVAADFRNSVSATGSILNLWVYARVQVETQSLGRRATTDLGGLCPGFPGGALL